ncbi:MAG: D-glycero-alpha-D-manno-heptose-1,7-bisphosphate 7-phosphatase [bacterium]
MTRRAILLDRDGVLVPDHGPVAPRGTPELCAGVPRALRRFAEAGFALAVVSNQTIVARGVASEAEVTAWHDALAAVLVAAGAPVPERFYFCPHHPSANVPAYRVTCPCRKPRPGMLLRAARELDLELAASIMIGDRPSDVAAGRRAGCRTALITSGKHNDPPIESPDALAASLLEPDWICADLSEAADRILGDMG